MKGPLARRPGPRRMQVDGAQKKKEVWPHNEERPTWTGSNKRYVFFSELAAIGGFFIVPQVCPIDAFPQLPKAQLRL